MQAIEFGLNMRSPGYNIFVTGAEGTGKSNIVQDLVTRHARTQPVPDDWCLVNNFQDEFRPRAIALPPGRGPAFAKRIGRLVTDLKKEIPRAFEEERYLKRLGLVKGRFASRQQTIFQKIERFAAGQGPAPRLLPEGVPDPADPRRQGALGGGVQEPPARAQSGHRREHRHDPVRDRTRRAQDREGQPAAADRNRAPDGRGGARAHAAAAPAHPQGVQGPPGVLGFLDALQTDIVENFNLFMPGDRSDPPAAGELPQLQRPPLQKYQVNVLVHRQLTRGAPVIFETNPSYYNVFGRIEKRAYMGMVNTDFTLVLAGSLLSANGGFLVMEMESLLMHPYVWEALKRALQTKRLSIEDLPEESGVGAVSLKPEPIPLEVKVVLLGGYEAFEALQNYDSKFNKIFRVRADFDDEVAHTREAELLYARFIARVCREEGLLPFNRRAVAAVVEFGQKHVADQRKLSIRFGRAGGRAEGGRLLGPTPERQGGRGQARRPRVPGASLPLQPLRAEGARVLPRRHRSSWTSRARSSGRSTAWPSTRSASSPSAGPCGSRPRPSWASRG